MKTETNTQTPHALINPAIDRSQWGSGPWEDEPDKLQWVDPDSNLDCLIVRQRHTGSLCGYVGVPIDHPLYGRGYNDDFHVDVHEGLNFSGPCRPHEEGDEAGVICHTPEPGRPHQIWWFGFSCNHLGDVQPAVDARPKMLDGWLELAALEFPSRFYRTVEYVEWECKYLARQLRALEGPGALETVQPGAPSAQQEIKLKTPKHVLYKTTDPDCPRSILDGHGEVVLGLCRVCSRGEIELSEPCSFPVPAAKETVQP